MKNHYLRIPALTFALLISLTGGATTTAPDLFPAPATAPKCDMVTDSLPAGKHRVSSYRNGNSAEVEVEDREIKSLKIDGKTIPADEFDDHLPMVEHMLGVRKDPDHNGDEWTDGDRFEQHFQRMETQFENMGEEWEELGSTFERLAERLADRFEGMFDSDGDGMIIITDSLHGFDDLFVDPPNRPERPRGTEAEIEEMETMIDRLERRKAELKRDMDRQNREADDVRREADRTRRDVQRDADGARRDAERSRRDAQRSADKVRGNAQRMAGDIRKEAGGMRADFKFIAEQIIFEGLADVKGDVKRISVNNDRLKLNGKSTSDEAHQRFLELYKERTGQEWSKSDVHISFD